MRYGQIRSYDVANGVGIRTSIFVTGCTHNCKGCFNKEYQNFVLRQIKGKSANDIINAIIPYLPKDIPNSYI